jgi:hypothetical protein
MDGNAKLTDTTLSRSLTVLYQTLDRVLDKAATVKATEKEGYLLDVIFNVAVLAGWIDVPTAVNLDPDNLHIIRPEHRPQYSQHTPTVVLGSFEVSEQHYDQFVSLFWHNNPAWIAKTSADITASIEAALTDPAFDPIEDLKNSIRQAIAKEGSTDSPPTPLEQQPTETNPALLLIAAKRALGVSWDKFAVIATKHLQELEAQELQAGTIASRTKAEVTRDDIFHLLRGQNVWPITVKAIASLLRAEPDTSQLRPGGWRWQDFVWPQTPAPKGRPRKKNK